jgi:hypothetical protein
LHGRTEYCGIAYLFGRMASFRRIQGEIFIASGDTSEPGGTVMGATPAEMLRKQAR